MRHHNNIGTFSSPGRIVQIGSELIEMKIEYNIFLVFLVHLNQKLIGKLIVYPCPDPEVGIGPPWKITSSTEISIWTPNPLEYVGLWRHSNTHHNLKDYKANKPAFNIGPSSI